MLLSALRQANEKKSNVIRLHTTLAGFAFVATIVFRLPNIAEKDTLKNY
jgi:hypothetical protein